MLYDAFIYKQHTNSYLIDCDLQVIADFIFHLKQYRLRSKVEVEDVSSSWSIVSSWNHQDSLHTGINTADRRCPAWTMSRACVPATKVVDTLSKDTQVYDTIRMIEGIPEGPIEIVRGKAIPMEFNMDLMGATDLHKGCYMGQELVARTLHRGVVRKRVLPIQLFEWDQPASSFKADPTKVFSGIEWEANLMPVEPHDAPSFADVTKVESEKSFGKLLRVLGNVGIALVRLGEIPPNGLFAVHRPTPSLGNPTFVLGKAIIPSWWPQSIHSNDQYINSNCNNSTAK